MRSNNPVFNRSKEFQSGGGVALAPDESRMTLDSVVQSTGLSLMLVIVAAVATWVLTPELNASTTDADFQRLYLATMAGSGGAFVLSMVNSFKRVIRPALVLAFCALEGVALGGISKVFDAQYGDGIISNAVVGTFAAFIGTLVAYKFFNIQVTEKFRKITIAAVLGMVALSVMEFILGFFGASFGLFAVSPLGMVTAVIGLLLGVFMLILDFDFVERGVENGLPERESWRAAFGITVSLVWIYTNLLRILAMARR